MRDRQVRPQRLQIKVWSGMVWLLRLSGSSSCGVFPEFGSAGIFKGGDDLVDSMALDLTVSSKCRPLVVVNVPGTEGLIAGLFKTFLWCPSFMIANGEFTIQGYLRQAMPASILDTCPAHRSCDFSNMVSMQVISSWSRTSILES